MINIVNKIKEELVQMADFKHVKSCQRFYVEPVKFYGVRTPDVRKMSSRYYQEVRRLTKEEIFQMCERLLSSDYGEEATIAFDWAFRLKHNYEMRDFTIFESWLKKYVNNWSKCDDFCTHAFGHLFLLYPELYPRVKEWVGSNNKWERRASAVIMIYPNRKINLLKEIFEISDLLMDDVEDLVQKGYGWTLKEASNKYGREVFAYVMRNKSKMTRTALRYAIEKMSADLKKKAMS